MLDKNVLEKMSRQMETERINEKIGDTHLGVFDRILDGIDTIFGIISSNEDKLDNKISKNEAEEILNKFR